MKILIYGLGHIGGSLALGIKKYYPNANYVAYNGSTLHPQFFNLSPTKTEFLSGAIPKKILIIGKSYYD